MQDIDFLPIEYRRQHVQRRAQPWRLIVAVAFGVLLTTAVCAQYDREQRTAAQLAAVIPQHELVLAERGQLDQIQSQLLAARKRAELVTYLRHPWPRTQLLSALLLPLPDEVTFQQLQIVSRRPPGQGSPDRRERSEGRFRVEQLAEQEDNLPPAQRDLEQLRGECDRTETVVLLSGITTDSAALHTYLGRLGDSELFAKAELDSIETAQHGQTVEQQFNATLIVCPGYGQPDGPVGPRCSSRRREWLR